MLIISWYITEAAVYEAHAIELTRLMFAVQNVDGGWPSYRGQSSTLMGTILVYIALRLLGFPASEPRMTKAREHLLDLGGPVYLPGWAKLWLAMLGLYGWEGTDPYPAEAWLLPDWVPISPWKWFIIPRQVYLSMSYLSSTRFTMATTPLLDQIRTEIFTEPYDSVNFAAYRDKAKNSSREQRKNWPLFLVNWILLNIWVPWLRPNSLAERAKHTVWEIIEESDQITHSGGSVSVDCFLNMIAFYSKEGVDSKRVRRIQEASREFLWMSSQGLQSMSIHGGHTWETSFVLQAYAEAGLYDDPEFRTAADRAYGYLVKQQYTEDLGENSQTHWFSRLGGWPFSARYHGLVCSDCTGEAFRAIMMIEENRNVVRVTNERHLQLGVDNLIMNQNATGGYSSFEPTRASQMIESLNSTEAFGRVLIEYDYIECTSSCITALSLYRRRNPAYRQRDVSEAIQRGVQYILDNQGPDGSWLAYWGIAYTYGAFFALEALAHAGLNYQNSDAVRRGCDFIVKHRRPDGGWGETVDVSSCHVSPLVWRDGRNANACQSILTGTYTQANESDTTQTAWVALALMHGSYPDQDLIRGAIRFIINQQREDGEWKQGRPTGSGIVTWYAETDSDLSHNLLTSLLARSRITAIFTRFLSGR